MFCPNCGENLPNDAVFCGNCGTKLTAAQPAQPTQPIQPAQPVRVATPANPAAAFSRANVATAPKRKRTKKARIAVTAAAAALALGIAGFSLVSCAGAGSAQESAADVANALNEAAAAFFESDRAEGDQVRAIEKVASMMPEDVAQEYLKDLGYKSADKAVQSLSEYECWDDVMELAGCVQVTFKANNSNSLGKESLKSYQNKLEDYGLEGEVEKVVPLSAKVKLTQSPKGFDFLTKGESFSTDYSGFYAVEVDDSWYLWIPGLEDGEYELSRIDKQW